MQTKELTSEKCYFRLVSLPYEPTAA